MKVLILSTLKSRLWMVVMLVILAMEVATLSGPHVCMIKQKYNITKRVKYRAPTSVRTYEWCLAMPPRCSKWTIEMRENTRLDTEERTAEMAVCCPGYKMRDVSCVPICPNGKTGPACSEDCPPNKWGPNCVHECKRCKEGICSPQTGQCQCQAGWQGESCDIGMSTTTSPIMEQLLTIVNTTGATKLTTQTPLTTAVADTNTISVTTTSEMNKNKSNVETKSASQTLQSSLVTSVSPPINENDHHTIITEKPKTTAVFYNTTQVASTIYSIEPSAEKPSDKYSLTTSLYNRTEVSVDMAKTGQSNKIMTLIPATSREMLTVTTIGTTTELNTQPRKSSTTNYVVFPEAPRTTTSVTINKDTTIKSETTRNTETTVKQSTTTKFKPKEIWIKPAQKEPEHITAVMGDKGNDRTSVDLISVLSIAGGIMMAIITMAVVIVMLERCKKPRYEDVRKYNDIRMQVMIDNNKNDVPPPPYVRSIFHTPLPDPPTEKCHYQPISTLDRNLKQFMRPVVVQTISPLMLENFRGILECHYDHLPRRCNDMGTMTTHCTFTPSIEEREELLTPRAHSLTDSAIEALKCEAKLDVIDNTTSEPLYAEIPCWRPPSEHAVEIMNLNGESVTEL